MATTSNLNIINLQVQAEDQIAIDMENGTYKAKIAADEKHYLWHGDYQTIPLGMMNDPELFASLLRESLPAVNTLRLPFNLNSFNADGSLHEMYERFLDAAAAEGFSLIMVQMEGDAQRLKAEGEDKVGEMRDALSGRVYDTMEEAWTKMLDWMDAHSSVKDAVWGHEIVNEPASYNQAAAYAPAGKKLEQQKEFVALYAEHMVELGQMIEERSDAKVLVGGWNYSARFTDMEDVTMGEGTALDHIREGLGDKLVWSAHFYPGWLGTTNMSDPEDVRATFDRIYAPVLDDTLLVTETNAQGNEAYNLHSDNKHVQAFVRAYDWFADKGVGITWFPGAQWGASNLVRMDPDGTLRFVHQASHAAAMNGYSLGGEDPRHAGDETVDITMLRARLRNQTNDPDHDPKDRFDDADYLAIGFGHGGHDLLRGKAEANNFLYGGTGDDVVRGNALDDFLYGQNGDDTIYGGSAGHDHLFGGRGNDILHAGAGITQMYGGAGGDTFHIDPKGKTVLVDFSRAEGDLLSVGSLTSEAFLQNARSVKWNNDNARDLKLALPEGGELVILGMGDRIDEVAQSLRPSDARFDDADPAPEKEADDESGNASSDAAVPENRPPEDTVPGDDAPDVNAGSTDDQMLFGTDGDDRLHGAAGNDTLSGGLGRDRLDGAGGNDTLRGDAGDDHLDGRDGDDHLHGGSGFDTISGHEGADTLEGGNGEDQLYGGSGDDLLKGQGGNDRLFGDSGDDVLHGGAGHDELHGGSGYDLLIGGASDDLIFGEKGADEIYGEAGQDRLAGGEGNDRLDGGSGSDWLEGGSGDDTATGGMGADTFMFNEGDNLLLITDFSTRQGDALRIDASLMNGDASLDALVASAEQSSVGTTIRFGDDESVLLEGFHDDLTQITVEFY